jgi:dTDP-4-amino-4,6-dideoxygalactose transaminase
MSWDVPITDLKVRDEDVESYLDSVRSCWWTMGPTTDRFEEEFEKWIGTQHAVVASSGTAALHLACAAANLGPGDEVLVPALTFVATAHAPRYVGAVPVLCDIAGRGDPHLSAETVEEAVTQKTKAVIAVNMLGAACDLEALRAVCDRHGLILIEDCAQSLGARTAQGAEAGTIGQFGCFSFFSKQQLAIGEGGMVMAQDGEAAERMRRLRSHGRTTSVWDRHIGIAAGYDVTDLGFNYRLDEPHSALGISRLPRVRKEIEGRAAVAAKYRAALDGLEGIELCWSAESDERSAHYAFPIVLRDAAARDEFRSRLSERGVQTTGYPPLHSLSEYRDARTAGSLEHATDFGSSHLVLPIYASLLDGRADRVIEAVEQTITQTA